MILLLLNILLILLLLLLVYHILLGQTVRIEFSHHLRHRIITSCNASYQALLVVLVLLVGLRLVDRAIKLRLLLAHA